MYPNCITLPDESLFVCGGWISECTAILKDGSLIKIPKMRRCREYAGIAYSNQKIYVFSGSYYDTTRNTSQLTDECEAFDLTTYQWTQISDLPEARKGLGAVTHGDRIFVGGGQVDGNLGTNRDVYIYYIHRDEYELTKIRTPISSLFHATCMFIVGRHIYIV